MNFETTRAEDVSTANFRTNTERDATTTEVSAKIVAVLRTEQMWYNVLIVVDTDIIPETAPTATVFRVDGGTGDETILEVTAVGAVEVVDSGTSSTKCLKSTISMKISMLTSFKKCPLIH